MTITNRYKLQTQVALGRSVYDVLSEIIRTGDTIDNIDRYILQKMQFQEDNFRKKQEEKEEKILMDKLEKKVKETMDDLLGSWK